MGLIMFRRCIVQAAPTYTFLNIAIQAFFLEDHEKAADEIIKAILRPEEKPCEENNNTYIEKI